MRRPHFVPFATQVVNLFKDLKLFTGGSPLCFPGAVFKNVPITDMALLNTPRRLGYTRKEMCVHGFRSVASTLLNEQGWRSDVIEAQLAHKAKDAIRAVYNESVK